MSQHGDQPPSFGDLLRRARRVAGVTQEDLAELAGLSVRGISDLERGIRRAPHLDTLERLMDALDLGDAERREWMQARRRASARSVDAGRAVSKAHSPAQIVSQSDTSRPSAPGREIVRLTGRDDELVALSRALDLSRHSAGSVVLLAGDPGIGKTRLAQQFASNALQSGAAVLWGKCSEAEGLPPYWPWIQLIRSWLLQPEGDDVRHDLGAGAPFIAQLVPEVRERLPDVSTPPAMPPDQARFHLFDGVAMWLLRASRRRPLVLVLDDLHWADTASLRLLQFVATRLHELRLVIVATYRDFELYARADLSETLADLSRQQSRVRIQLDGLDEAAVTSVIEQLAEEAPSREFAATIHRQTEGNPFFVIEVVRLLANLGTWELAETHGVHAIPGSVREVTRQRISALSVDCQSLLATAAIIGREFSLPLLAAVSEQRIEQLLDPLDEATHAHVIQVIDTAGYMRFVHALIRETLYADLSTVRRMHLHALVAATLEKSQASTLVSRYDDIARHYWLAAPIGYAENAIDYSLRAARHAMARAAWETAIDRYLRAIEAFELVLQPDLRQQCDVLLALGEAQNVAAGLVGSSDARATFLRAAELASQMEEPALFARAAIGFAGLNPLRTAGGIQQIQLLQDALRMLGNCEGVLTIRVLARLAASLTGRSSGNHRDIAQAREFSDAAVAMARRVGDPSTLVYALLMWHVAHPDPDELDARLAATDEAIRLAAAAGDREWLAWHHDLRCNDLLELGARDQAEQEMQFVRRTAVELHLPGMERSVLNRQAERDLGTGRYDRAETSIHQMMQSYEPSAVSLPRLWKLYFLRREQGRLDEIAGDVRAPRGAAGDLFELAFVLILDLELGSIDKARAAFSRIAHARYRELTRDTFWLMTLALHAEVSHALDDAERAGVLFPLLEPYASRNVGISGSLYLGALARFLGLLAITRRDWGTAERHFHDAIAMNTRLGMLPYVSHAQYGYADMLTRRGGPGDREKALDLADQVLEVASRLGMLPLQKRADALKAQFSRRQDESAVSTRERDVLRLLAEGYSNQEIAAALFISPNTVANHVTNILNKLGLESRAAAAAWAVRNGIA